MYSILVCDDDRDILRSIKIYLEDEGYKVFTAENGEEAERVIDGEDIHLVLMDIMMPKKDGISALASLRERNNIPVILLSAKSEDTDKILGLDMGADDYVTKPFNPSELIARVRSQLRRYMILGSGRAAEDRCLRVGGIILDKDGKTVTLDGEEIALTPMEFEILRVLMTSPGKVFSPKEIYFRVRNEEPFGAENIIAVHIRHIREKLEIDPAEPRYLKVVWGQGYKLESVKEAY